MTVEGEVEFRTPPHSFLRNKVAQSQEYKFIIMKGGLLLWLMLICQIPINGI